MAVSMTAFWNNVGTVIPGGDAEYVVAEQPIAEYDNWFNYNIVTDIQAVIDDVINKFNANTILKADTDNTPAALAIAEQTIVGRKTGSSIAALTATEVRTILNVEDGADVTDSTNVDSSGAAMESDFNATTFLYATSDNTPQPKTPSDVRTILNVENGATADQTGGEIKAAYEAEANAYTDTKNTKLAGIDTGADVTADNPPQAHGASSHTDRTRAFLVCPHHHTSGDTTSTGVALDPTTVQNVVYRFGLPKDFVSLTSVKVLWTVDDYDTVDGNVVLDINVKFGTPPQTYSLHDNDDVDNVIAITGYSVLSQWTFTIDSSAFTNIVQGDVVLITVERDADHASDTFTKDAVILGLSVEYTSDM